LVVVDFDGVLDLDDLPAELADRPANEAAAPAGGTLADALIGRPLEEVERHYITETLKLTGGNREEAAALLGMGERTLYRKIKEFQL
jgi:two-component system response regulator HydG